MSFYPEMLNMQKPWLGSLQCLWPQRIFFDAMKLMKRLGLLLHNNKLVILIMQILFRENKESSKSSAMSKRSTFPWALRQRLTFSVVSASTLTPEIIHPESWWPSSKAEVVTSINGFTMEELKITRYYNSHLSFIIIPFLDLMRDGGWSSDRLSVWQQRTVDSIQRSIWIWSNRFHSPTV